MNHSREFTAFNDAMKKILSVSKQEMQRRLEEEKKSKTGGLVGKRDGISVPVIDEQELR